LSEQADFSLKTLIERNHLSMNGFTSIVLLKQSNGNKVTKYRCNNKPNLI